MTHDPSIRPDAARLPDAAPGTPSRATRGGDGAAFRALLEKLEVQAQRLRVDGDTLHDPAELAGAVDRARASIEDAVSLGEDLLEAYRAARQRAETGTEDDAR